MDELQLEFQIAQQKLLEPLKNLQESYEVQLGKLLESTAAKGQLDRTLLVRKELEVFRKGEQVASDSFPDLQRLQRLYARNALERIGEANYALKDLSKTYRSRLESMQKFYTEGLNLDEAVKVKNALAMIPASFQVPVPGYTPPEESTQPARIQWKGETVELKVDARMFTNRDYRWVEVPEKYQDWRMAMRAGGSSSDTVIQVEAPGLVYVLVSTGGQGDFEKDGWILTDTFRGGIQGKNDFLLMRKSLEAGQHTIPAATFFATRIVLPPGSRAE